MQVLPVIISLSAVWLLSYVNQVRLIDILLWNKELKKYLLNQFVLVGEKWYALFYTIKSHGKKGMNIYGKLSTKDFFWISSCQEEALICWTYLNSQNSISGWLLNLLRLADNSS